MRAYVRTYIHTRARARSRRSGKHGKSASPEMQSENWDTEVGIGTGVRDPCSALGMETSRDLRSSPGGEASRSRSGVLCPIVINLLFIIITRFT